MSDKNNPGDVTLTITISPTRGVVVTGPIDNAVLAYGILEIGRDAIQAHNASKDAQRRIELASANALPGNGSFRAT